jgi:serine/threonine protein phosphatase PrpC
MIGCDGIFERLSNRDCIDYVWNKITEQITLSNKMNNGAGELKGKRDDSKKRQMINAAQNAKIAKSGKGGMSVYNEHQAAADGVEILIRAAAASRSLDNITSLILGLKGLKKTIQKLNAGSDLNQIR